MCIGTVYAQLPPMFEQMAMAMAGGGGQGAGAMNPLMLSAMMNPTAGGETSAAFNEMAMMNMMMNGNANAGSMLDTQSRVPTNSNDTSARRGMVRPPVPVNRGPNINDIMSMMMLSNSGGTPSTDTLQKMGAMRALQQSNTRVLNPSLRPNQLMDLTRDGAGVSAVLARQICPPQRCPFRAPCESPIITYKPDTFFVCPDCPKCPFEIMMGVMNPSANSMSSMGRRTLPMMRRNMLGRQRMGRQMPMRVFPMGSQTGSRNATASAA
ncbi:hypothetical protein KP79_PYT19316 [Mizuhopecten yessoensis]|uniref:Uncharacterized protein n=1 Tax=Mizuhopecten yessoensis TaxID=6573 RepID=A0A210Q9I9_MIZYE|nr:hypothetical protein KP79_PYT19316 [Mizuhopecten yessoensis]